MNIKLLKQYNLKFVKTKDIRGNIGFGVMSTNGKGGVSEFLDDIILSEDAIDCLSRIKLYLEGESPEFDSGLYVSCCYANIYESKIYIRSISPDITYPIDIVPLKDFHDLLEMWRDFLIENGN